MATFRIEGETQDNGHREKEKDRGESNGNAVNDNVDNRLRESSIASAVPLSDIIEFAPDTPTSEKSHSLSTSQKSITASSSTAELESSVDSALMKYGGEVSDGLNGNGTNKSSPRREGDVSGRVDGTEGRIGTGAERTLIVLFDNSYSWYTAKEIK